MEPTATADEMLATYIAAYIADGHEIDIAGIADEMFDLGYTDTQIDQAIANHKLAEDA